MMGRVLRSLVAVGPVAALLIGCVGGTVTPGQPSGSDGTGGPHLMLRRSNDRHQGTESIDAVPAAAKLTYRGGPVLQNVAVSPVWWNSGVQFTNTLPGFYKAAIASSYYDWLTEYNTTSPVNKFGEGTLLNNGTQTTGGTNLTDAQVQSGLASLIDAGK